MSQSYYWWNFAAHTIIIWLPSERKFRTKYNASWLAIIFYHFTMTIASTVYVVDYYTLYSFALNASSTVMENMTFITVKNHRILFFIHNLQSSQWSDTTTITTVTTTWVLILDKPCMLFIYVSHFHIWCDMSTSPVLSALNRNFIERLLNFIYITHQRQQIWLKRLAAIDFIGYTVEKVYCTPPNYIFEKWSKLTQKCVKCGFVCGKIFFLFLLGWILEQSLVYCWVEFGQKATDWKSLDYLWNSFSFTVDSENHSFEKHCKTALDNCVVCWK